MFCQQPFLKKADSVISPSVRCLIGSSRMLTSFPLFQDYAPFRSHLGQIKNLQGSLDGLNPNKAGDCHDYFNGHE